MVDEKQLNMFSKLETSYHDSRPQEECCPELHSSDAGIAAMADPFVNCTSIFLRMILSKPHKTNHQERSLLAKP